MAWNDGIVGQGLTIAASTESTIRVMAGPGAGKSFSLMRRIARLLESGISPDRILLVTFTRTAAHALKNDLNELDVPGVDQIDAGTLHAFCFRMLRKEAVLEQTGRHPRPLFDFEKDVLLHDLSRLHGNVGITVVKRKINAFEAAWSRLQDETPGWPTDPDDRAFHQLLIAYLRFHRAMLIGEVIPEALKYLRQNPAVEELTQYDYVFVDEYQDLNRAEQELVNLIGANSNLMVIGDEDQSIYQSFRHANPEGIRTFDESHADTVDYPLEECRRCPKRVVRIADELIQYNENREERHLIQREANPDGTVHSIQWPDFTSETIGIAEFIKRRIEQGIAPGDILVLSPRKDLGYSLRDELIEKEIEAHSFFREELFEDVRVKKSVCILTLLINREDRVALRVWLSFDTTTRNSPAYTRLYEYCRSQTVSPNNALVQLTSGDITIPYTNPIQDRYTALQGELEELEELNALELRDELFPPDQEWSTEMQSILENLKEDDGASKILELISSAVINPEPPMEVNYVRVMSLHKSKGLSAEVVIVRGMIQGLIPRLQDDEDGDAQAHLEEQRRLFYVAITRPVNELVVSTVARIPKTLGYELNLGVPYGPYFDMPAIASSFLAELGEQFPDGILGENWEEISDVEE